MVHLYPRRPTFGLHMHFWTLVGQLGISNSFYFYLNVKWIFHVIFMYYHLTFIFKGKGSNMPLNYSKGLDIPRLKFGQFIPSRPNFWSTYALMGVSRSIRNIQLILLLFKCQMDFSRHFYVLSLDIYIHGKRVKYVPKLFKKV